MQFSYNFFYITLISLHLSLHGATPDTSFPEHDSGLASPTQVVPILFPNNKEKLNEELYKLYKSKKNREQLITLSKSIGWHPDLQELYAKRIREGKACWEIMAEWIGNPDKLNQHTQKPISQNFHLKKTTPEEATKTKIERLILRSKNTGWNKAQLALYAEKMRDGQKLCHFIEELKKLK
jgi:hypothetical protein